MPISMEQFDGEYGSEEARILNILNKEPLQAYSLSDLAPKTENTLERIVVLIALQYTLEGMSKKNLVKSKVIQGATYYISSKAKPSTTKYKEY